MQCHTKFKSSERNFYPLTPHSFCFWSVDQVTDWYSTYFVSSCDGDLFLPKQTELEMKMRTYFNPTIFVNGIRINFSYKICSNENVVCVICLLPFHEKKFGFPIETK